MPSLFGKNLSSSGIRTRDMVIRSWDRSEAKSALFCKLKYSDEIKIYNESILNTRDDNTFSKQKQWCIKIIIYAYFCLFSASKVIMPYGKLITRFTTGGHIIFITCPAKSMHLEPFGLSVHTFCGTGGTGDENIIPTCRSADNYYILYFFYNFSRKRRTSEWSLLKRFLTNV